MHQFIDKPAGFSQKIVAALGQLKQQLQRDYEKAYPQLREIIRLILDHEESRARELSAFPHLLLPDLVEAHVANLNLQPVEAKHADVFRPRGGAAITSYQPAFALCA